MFSSVYKLVMRIWSFVNLSFLFLPTIASYELNDLLYTFDVQSIDSESYGFIWQSAIDCFLFLFFFF